LRTFANIKNWTSLSIPSGLQFRAEYFPFDDVAAAVAAQCLNPHPDAVRVVVQSSGITLWGDRLLVEILLRNLVSNALQHTPQGTVTLAAEVSPDDSRFSHISVSDTGTGMDPDTLETLFRPDKPLPNAVPSAPAANDRDSHSSPNLGEVAQRAGGVCQNPSETQTENTGHGFGLILCRYIVKLHDDNTIRGCRIWAESPNPAATGPLNPGTVMHLCLPQAPAATSLHKPLDFLS
jgi:K+-sensing histidine kinase KdpD